MKSLLNLFHQYLLSLLLVGFCFMLSPSEVQAQRMAPGQKGFSLNVGTTGLEASEKQFSLFQEGAYAFSLEYHQYFKRYNYWFASGEVYTHTHQYNDWKVPVSIYTAHIGYDHPLLYDYTKTLLIYGGVAAVGGYQNVNGPKNDLFPNGAKLSASSQFVYGGEARMSIVYMMVDNFALVGSWKHMFLWGSDLNIYYPQLSVGIKLNI